MTRRFLSYALLVVAGSSAGLYMTTGAIAFPGRTAEQVDGKAALASKPATLVAARPPVPVVLSPRDPYVAENQPQVHVPRDAAVRGMSPVVIRAGSVAEPTAVQPAAVTREMSPAVIRAGAVSEPVRVANKAPDRRVQARAARNDGGEIVRQINSLGAGVSRFFRSL